MKTNEMEEAVKVVAEFMGVGIESSKMGDVWAGRYDRSLDSLVPVWEKLELFTEYSFDLCRELKDERRWGFSLENFTRSIKFESSGETIQQAALLATAKVIESLRNERSENTGELKNV